MTQITDLPQAQTPLSPGDVVLVIQSGTPKQVAQSQIGTQEAITPGELPIATNSLVGAVKPDGSSITVGPDGTITSHSSVTGATITGTPATGNLTQFSGASTITNGDLTGDVTTSGGLATTIHKISGVTVSSTTGTTNLVFSNSPTLVTPNLGTPSTLVGTNITGTAAGLTSGHVTTIPTLTGDIQNTGNATTVTAIQGTFIAGTSGTGNIIFENSPTLITPALGTPSSVDLVNASGVALNLTAGALSNQTANTLAGFGATGAYQDITVSTGLNLISGVLTASAAAPVFGQIQSGTNTTAAMVIGTGSSLSATGSGSIVATTNANLTGPITSVGNATSVASQTGTGSTFVMNTSPTLVTPNLGTPSAAILTSATGLPISTGISGLAAGIATFLSTPTSANLITAVTDETGTGSLVFATSPTLVTPALGTPSAIVLTNATGTAASLTAGHVTTNANLTGPITSVGNATSVASQTGTGSTFVMNTSPTLVTPNLGTPTALTLTSATGLPVATGISGLGAGIATWLATPTSANLATAVATTSTGSGSLVFGTSPTLTTPALGTPSAVVLTNATGTAASLTAGTATALANNTANTLAGFGATGVYSDITVSTGLSLSAGVLTASGTAPAFSAITSATNTTAAMVVGTGASLAASGSGTITATAVAVGGITGLAAGVATFLATPSSANLLSALTTSTGTGTNVFSTSPTLVTPTLGVASATSVAVTGSSAPAAGVYLPSANTVGISANSLPVEELVGVASAVDYMLITNAATATQAAILYTPTGTDTNIGETHTMKGLGQFTIAYTGGDAGNNNSPLTVDASSSSLNGNPAFKVLLPSTGAGKAFQFSNSGSSTGWGSFEYNIGGTGLAGLGLGSGSATRDLFLYRNAVSTLNIGSASGNSSGTVNAGVLNLGTALGVSSGGTGVTTSTGTGNNVLSASPALTGVPTVPTAAALTNNTQAASTAYVDTAVSVGISGLTSKGAATLISTSNIAGTYLTGTFTATSTGVITIDGVAVASGMIIALVGQTGTGGGGLVNGLYNVTTPGSVGVAMVLTRTSNYNTSAEVLAGTYFVVDQGTANTGTFWLNTTSGAITLGTTALVFTEITIGSLPASSLTGSTLAASVTASSLTSFGSNIALGTPASGALGSCTATTQTAGSNDTKIATDAYADQEAGYIKNAISVTTNAGSTSVSFRNNDFTNSSASAMTITLTTTGAKDGQPLMLRIYDFSAAAQGITFVNSENSSVSVPTTSNGSTTLPLTVGFQYNAGTSKWRCVAFV